MKRILALLVAASLVLSPISVRSSHAEDDGSAGNGTLLIAAGVGILVLLVAWQMDFGDDDMSKVVAEKMLASNDEGDVGFGFEF